MQKIITILIILGLASTLQLSAANPNRRNAPERKAEKLTTYQIKVVKTILAKYDSDSLTSDDAKAISEEIRKADIHLGPETDIVIKEAGFDPEKLRELAPPPERKQGMRPGDNHNMRIQDIQPDNHPTARKEANSEMSDEIPRGLKHNYEMTDFQLTSKAINEEDYLNSEYTGDGAGISMPLEWTNVPEGTKYFALNLWHLPNPEDRTEVKSYWVLYDIPANITSLPENVQNIGSMGYNDKDEKSYDPMKSKGPGKKIYNITLYALSEKPVFTTETVYRNDLLKAIKGITIDECTLSYIYERDVNK